MCINTLSVSVFVRSGGVSELKRQPADRTPAAVAIAATEYQRAAPTERKHRAQQGRDR